MEKKEYNATGQLLDFIPKFYLGLIIMIIIWIICILLIIIWR